MNIPAKSCLDVIDTAQLQQREKTLLQLLLLVLAVLVLHQWGGAWLLGLFVGSGEPTVEAGTALVARDRRAVPLPLLRRLHRGLGDLADRQPMTGRLLRPGLASLAALIGPATAMARPALAASEAVPLGAVLLDVYPRVQALALAGGFAGNGDPTAALLAQMQELARRLGTALPAHPPLPDLAFGPRLGDLDPGRGRNLFEFAAAPAEGEVPVAP